MSKRDRTKRSGAATPAIEVLEQSGLPYTAHPYQATGGSGRHNYGMEAAEALGLSPDRIYKTLLVDCADPVDLAVAILPVSARLDPKAFAAAVGTKRAELADPTRAERVTGYVVGGISPLGQKRRLPTVLDAAALDLDTVYVSAGRRGLQVELAPTDLVHLTGAVTASITR